MKRDKVKLLYRNENTGSRLSHLVYGKGSKYKYERHTKRTLEDAAMGVRRKGMNPHKVGITAYDYTPLFKYLLTHAIGKKADEVRAWVKPRLNSMEPFDWMVHDHNGEKPEKSWFRAGENSYWSQLYVDSEGIIQKADPNLANVHPAYGDEWGASFNGKPLGSKNWLRNAEKGFKNEEKYRASLRNDM